ncbi:Lrp/AsnC family transcriptional regulator [Pedobacter sp. WC2423]|uniref:Lrp/AsnC family transcriptional regulator n=1 Tax=Pedobacter sp. WC2423 TaxID=3234142 RepID=UPI0034660EB9
MTELDVTDKEILRILQINASITHKQLSEQLYKSVATIHERIRRLKNLGYIMRTVVILDRRKIEMNLIAYSQVLLNDHAAETLKGFEDEVVKFPEVMECLQMTGSFDFVLKIATRDMDTYHDFYRRKLTTLPNITTVQSFFVLSEAKTDTAYPIS